MTDLTKDQKIARQSSELKKLQEDQIDVAAGNKKPDLVTANMDENFQIRKLEAERYVHVWTRVRNLDSNAKKFVDEDKVILIHKREFAQRVKDGAFKTYDEVKVIHDPRKNPEPLDLQPDRVNPGGDIQQQVDDKATSKEREKLEKEKLNNQKTLDALNKKKEEQEQKDKELTERQKALEEREAKLNAQPTAPAAPTAPASSTATATTTAPATEDKTKTKIEGDKPSK